MGCDAEVACKMVMHPALAAYSKTDEAGNFVLSRDGAISVLRINRESDAQSTTS